MSKRREMVPEPTIRHSRSRSRYRPVQVVEPVTGIIAQQHRIDRIFEVEYRDRRIQKPILLPDRDLNRAGEHVGAPAMQDDAVRDIHVPFRRGLPRWPVSSRTDR